MEEHPEMKSEMSQEKSRMDGECEKQGGLLWHDEDSEQESDPSVLFVSFHCAVSVQVTSILAKAWKALSNEDRAKWDELAEEEKKKVAAENAAAGFEEEPKKKKPSKAGGKKKRDTGAPHKPKNPLQYFLESKKRELAEKEPGLSAKEIHDQLTGEWKKMDVRNTRKAIQFFQHTFIGSIIITIHLFLIHVVLSVSCSFPLFRRKLNSRTER